MLVPLSWIRELTPVEATTGELVDALNQLGLEVERVEQPGREIAGVRAARILDVLEHPDADTLRLADVDYGDGQVRVVCGAPNIAAGMLVPYASVGATLPDGLTIERRTIRGVASDGMLLSARELGLGDDHSGIVELPPGTEVGIDVRAALGLDDTVLDVSVTPNRPDAMCMVGIARELAAHFGWPLTVREPEVSADGEVEGAVSVEVEDLDRCPRYLARVASVVVGPSPSWLAQRLVKAGMRPISNVVDVTNYVLLERNQPLHAFDLARLGGPGIVVRTAVQGEGIKTLDGVDRELGEDDLLICDGQRVPQAIAGIMGGSTSEVSEATTEILLEAAYFERMGIARSSKRLKLRSESSARFERGIDPNGVGSGAERAMELLTQVAGARVAPNVVDVYPSPVQRQRITVRTAKVNAVLGTQLDDGAVRDALVPIGIDVEGDAGVLVAVPPTFRPDLEREIDLVEEVARRIGFDAIGRTIPRPSQQVGGLTRRQREQRLAADVLVGAGFSEAITVPLVAPADLEGVGAAGKVVVEVANPLRLEESVLRTRLLPGLLRTMGSNHAQGLVDVACFELGRVFLAPDHSSVLPSEPTHLAAVVSGAVKRRPVESDRPVDGLDALDALRQVLDAFEVGDVRIEPGAPPGLHSGRAAVVRVDGHEAGAVGEVAPDVSARFGIDGTVAAFEVNLDALYVAARRDRRFRRPSVYPPAGIDLAFVVDDTVPAGRMTATLAEAAGPLLEDLRLFDVFHTEAIGSGRRSLAFSLRFRAPDRTLTDEEVGALRAACIAAAERAHGAQLRS